MSGIPYTTTIDVLRSVDSTGGDATDQLLSSYGTETGDATTIDTVRKRIATLKAFIGNPSGTENIIGGDQEVVAFKLVCEPFDLDPRDQVRDRSNGTVYDVVWAVVRREFKALEHTQGALSRNRGAA